MTALCIVIALVSAIAGFGLGGLTCALTLERAIKRIGKGHDHHA